MPSLVLSFLLLALPPLALAQLFTRILDSPVATDGGSSANVSWVDVENDGDLDLFITNDEVNQGNFLYLNDGTGTFTAVEGDPILETGGHNVGATWGDFDSDGDADCFVARWSNQNNKLYVNNGDGSFQAGAFPPITNSFGYSETGSWADYNSDGWLDLFVTNSAGNNHHNWLYDGSASGVFTSHNDVPFSIEGDDSRAAQWCDVNADGLPDLFVANENSDNDALYTNLGQGLFTSTEGVPPTTDFVSNFTASWGDMDNDGDFDLFVGTYGGGSLLYRNTGGQFESVAGSPVSAENQQAVGSAFADYDNDGDLDLLVTNGFAANGNIYRKNRLYDNDGTGGFVRATNEPIEADSGWGFGCAFGDMDGDQDLDLCIARSRNADEDNLLYRNVQTENNGIVLRLRGTTSNRSAIGSVVRIGNMVRQVEGQSGYCGQTLDLHFGLGQMSVVDSIVVRWPSGAVERFESVAANTTYTLVEGEGLVNVEERKAPLPSLALLVTAYPNPFNSRVTLESNLPVRERTSVQVFNTLGQSVATLHDGVAGPGELRLNWMPMSLTSGVYVVSVTQGAVTDSQKIQFVK